MHGEWQIFSPTLLVKMEGSIIIRFVALYALARVWRRGERKKDMCARSSRLVGRGGAWHGEAMGAGARCARE
jgi:hypothetical protein